MPDKVNDTDSRVFVGVGVTLESRSAPRPSHSQSAWSYTTPHAVEYAGKQHRESEASSSITRSPLQIRSTQIVNVTHLAHLSRTIGFRMMHLLLDDSCSQFRVCPQDRFTRHPLYFSHNHVLADGPTLVFSELMG